MIYSGKYRNAGFAIQLFPASIVIENQVPIDLLHQISTKELFLEFTQWFSVSLWVQLPCKTSAIITSRTILSRKITFTRINSRSQSRSCCEYWRFSLFWRDPQTASEFQIKVGILAEVCLCNNWLKTNSVSTLQLRQHLKIFMDKLIHHHCWQLFGQRSWSKHLKGRNY